MVDLPLTFFPNQTCQNTSVLTAWRVSWSILIQAQHQLSPNTANGEKYLNTYAFVGLSHLLLLSEACQVPGIVEPHLSPLPVLHEENGYISTYKQKTEYRLKLRSVLVSELLSLYACPHFSPL